MKANEEKTALQHQIALLKSDKDKILSDLKTQNVRHILIISLAFRLLLKRCLYFLSQYLSIYPQSVIEGMKDIHTKQERSLQNSLASINVELLKLRFFHFSHCFPPFLPLLLLPLLLPLLLIFSASVTYSIAGLSILLHRAESWQRSCARKKKQRRMEVAGAVAMSG